MKTALALSTASLAILTSFAVEREARADDQVPAPPAPIALERDRAAPVEHEPDFKSVAITLNPLSLILTRVGVNVEYLPAKHHGIMLNPYFQSIKVGNDPTATSYTNFGGELGYHYYTGSKGANGFFVGPSLIIMNSNFTDNSMVNGKLITTDGTLMSYGAALDFGGQHVFDNGFTIGGGAGFMYLASNGSSTQTSSTVKFEGVLPRFLFTAGYSF